MNPQIPQITQMEKALGETELMEIEIVSSLLTNL